MVSLLLTALAVNGQAPVTERDEPDEGPALGTMSRAQGVVLDEKGQPMKGAKVTLRLESNPSEGPPSVLTDKKGKWAIATATPGRYRLTIEAAGYISANGWTQVAARPPFPSTKVELRPLTEVTPGGLESNPKTVLVWLEKGNSLLAQGKPAEARGEYEKAAKVLAGKDLAEVLRTIARTYFLEGNRASSFDALKRALLAEPEDAEARRLLTALATEGKEAADVNAWLARLDREGRESLAAEFEERQESPDGGLTPAQEVTPAEPAAANRVGAYKTFFTQSAPNSSIEEWGRRFDIAVEDIAKVDATGGRYELKNESFEVFAPDTYRPEKPAGLFVWVSPGPTGATRRPETRQALADLNVIWVGANNSGNTRPRWNRMGLALDAVHNLKKLYNIDPRRIYVGGYSGGGRVSSALLMRYPEVFQGAYCFMGTDYFRPIAMTDKPGASWLPGYPQPEKDSLKEIKESHRLVLITGELDFNRAQTKAYYAEFQRDDFRHVSYIEMPGASHYGGWDFGVFRQGLEALDRPLGLASSRPSKERSGSR